MNHHGGPIEAGRKQLSGLLTRSGGVLVHAFESLFSARFVAWFRLIIAIMFLLAVWVDPAQPVRGLAAGMVLAGAFLGWSLVNIWAAHRDWWIEHHLARPALFVDLAVGIAATFFTEGPRQDFVSPQAAFLMFALAEAMFVGGWALTSKAGIAFILGKIAVSVLLATLGQPIDFIVLGRRIASFLLITSLAVWLAGRRIRPRVPAFVIPPDLRERYPVADAMAFAAKMLGATRILAVWKSPVGAGVRMQASNGDEAVTAKFEPNHAGFIAATAGSPTLFRVGRMRALRLDDSDRPTRGDAPNLALQGYPPEGSDAIAIPVAIPDFEMTLVASGLRSPSRDLLAVARSLGAEIEAGMNRHALAVRVFDDQLGEVRHTIARDLHDSVAQSLAGASFRIEAARKALEQGVDPAPELRSVQQALHSEQRHVRDIIDRLRRGSEMRVRHDLGSDLAALLRDLEEHWRIGIEFVGPAERFEVGTAQLHELRQIAREAVANAARHGNGGKIRFALDVADHAYHVDIVDDGSNAEGSSHPFQPRSISERVAALGGKLDARRGPAGTRLYITVPRLSA